ncbi:MAG: hypothetical protein CMF52_04025 [Legionellales bacterium]|nr:hypothetical protein [Legionellales bacterium]HAV93792.1 hypothetical protein [Pseudomonadota bacterium]
MDQNAFETGARQCVAITASPEINSLETAVASEIRTADVDDSLDGRLFLDLTNLVRQIDRFRESSESRQQQQRAVVPGRSNDLRYYIHSRTSVCMLVFCMILHSLFMAASAATGSAILGAQHHWYRIHEVTTAAILGTWVVGPPLLYVDRVYALEENPSKRFTVALYVLKFSYYFVVSIVGYYLLKSIIGVEMKLVEHFASLGLGMATLFIPKILVDAGIIMICYRGYYSQNDDAYGVVGSDVENMATNDPTLQVNNSESTSDSDLDSGPIPSADISITPSVKAMITSDTNQVIDADDHHISFPV